MKNFGSKNKPFSWVKKHRLYSFLIALILLAGGVFGYNKYLDWRNVQDMKALLSAFEQLEKDVEGATGEELTIEADCGSVGKFATSYACSLYLLNPNPLSTEYPQAKLIKAFRKKENACRVISSDDASAYGSYTCSIDIRKSNINTAETIFYQYDTSPGRAF